MSHALGSKLHFEPGSILEAGFELCIGALVGAAHSVNIVANWWYTNLLVPSLSLFGINLKTEKHVQSRDGEKTLKVVAVGYGRTGTYSLTLALEELGFPTLHTQHLYENEAIFSMWYDRIFQPSVAEQKTRMGKPDLKLITDYGYQGTADLPMALYFEQVLEEYPDCKFILTTRENSEVWFRSWDKLTQTITQPTQVGGVFFKSVRQYSVYLRWLYSVVNKDEAYLSAPFPLPPQHKETAIESYEEHNRRVREAVPAERLLEYNVKEGWEPLCKFMDIDECPTTPFPKTNSARSLDAQVISGQIFPAAVAIFVASFIFRLFFKRATGKTFVEWLGQKSKSYDVKVKQT